MIRISLWTAVFLVVLRVAIGWHFFFEGVSKVKSTYAGKPFSSETYFRESEGPFGKLIKSQVGDPDQILLDKLTPQSVEGDASKTNPVAMFPPAMAVEWNDYFARFTQQYRLDDAQKTVAETRFEQSKADYVKWLLSQSNENDASGKPKEIKLTVKRKAPGLGSADFDEEVTVAERVLELKRKHQAVRDALEKKLPTMGKDVEGPNLRTLKAEVAEVRRELQKEVDAQTEKMKEALAKGVFGGKPTANATPINPGDANAFLMQMLTPMKDGKNPLALAWDEYSAYVKDYSPKMNDETKARVDEAVANAKIRFDHWLADKEPYTGVDLVEKPMTAWRSNLAAAESRLADASAKLKSASSETEKKKYADAESLARSDIESLRNYARAEIKTQVDALKIEIGNPLLGDERAKGYAAKGPEERWFWVVPKNWTAIQFLDWSTRWFLAVVGSMLMFGLWTRLSCFAAAGFLLLTILTQLSLPWMPSPPNQEGTYVFVSKNAIEMFALLALMGARTGHWVGVDALIDWLFGRKKG